MWGLELEELIFLNIVRQNGVSDIVSSGRCPRVFIQIGQKFTSHREDSFVEMYILLRLVVFCPCGRGEKVGNKWNNRSDGTIFWEVLHPVPLFWLVVESNKFCYVSLIYSIYLTAFYLTRRTRTASSLGRGSHSTRWRTSTCSNPNPRFPHPTPC